jgi:glycosyltransferase involved in cell wall biosynthesis
MKTLIVMVTYYRDKLTRKSINTLFKNTKEDFVLHIIDNNSKDGTRDYLQRAKNEQGNKIKLTLLDENIGKARAANIGFKDCKDYDYLVGMDNDIVVPEKWLSTLIECSTHFSNWGLLALNSHVHKCNTHTPKKRLPNGKTLLLNRCVAGGIWLINKRVYNKIGGYQEKRKWGGIDGGYNNASRKAGFKNAILQDISFQHLNDADYKDYTRYKTHVAHVMKKNFMFKAEHDFFEQKNRNTGK